MQQACLLHQSLLLSTFPHAYTGSLQCPSPAGQILLNDQIKSVTHPKDYGNHQYFVQQQEIAEDPNRIRCPLARCSNLFQLAKMEEEEDSDGDEAMTAIKKRKTNKGSTEVKSVSGEYH